MSYRSLTSCRSEVPLVGPSKLIQSSRQESDLWLVRTKDVYSHYTTRAVLLIVIPNILFRPILIMNPNPAHISSVLQPVCEVLNCSCTKHFMYDVFLKPIFTRDKTKVVTNDTINNRLACIGTSVVASVDVIPRNCNFFHFYLHHGPPNIASISCLKLTTAAFGGEVGFEPTTCVPAHPRKPR